MPSSSSIPFHFGRTLGTPGQPSRLPMLKSPASSLGSAHDLHSALLWTKHAHRGWLLPSLPLLWIGHHVKWLAGGRGCPGDGQSTAFVSLRALSRPFSARGSEGHCATGGLWHAALRHWPSEHSAPGRLSLSQQLLSFPHQVSLPWDSLSHHFLWNICVLLIVKIQINSSTVHTGFNLTANPQGSAGQQPLSVWTETAIVCAVTRPCKHQPYSGLPSYL